jgi:hypothetical protein
MLVVLVAVAGCGDAELVEDALEELDIVDAPLSGAFDKNGVAYFALGGTYVSERSDWTEDFNSDGSFRHDFERAPDSNQCLVGYFFVDGPSGEEISIKLQGGPHNDSNPTWADVYDLGVTNFSGTRSRLRYEATHPSYSGAVKPKSFKIGDIRKKWVGAMGCKLNVDANSDGKVEAVRVYGAVDPGGLTASGEPANKWVTTYDNTFAVSEVKLKSPTVPYVVTIGQSAKAQATIRIDEQSRSTYQHKFVSYRVLNTSSVSARAGVDGGTPRDAGTTRDGGL